MWILRKSPKKKGKRFKIRPVKKTKSPLILERNRYIKKMLRKQHALAPKSYIRIPGYKLFWRSRKRMESVASQIKEIALNIIHTNGKQTPIAEKQPVVGL